MSLQSEARKSRDTKAEQDLQDEIDIMCAGRNVVQQDPNDPGKISFGGSSKKRRLSKKRRNY